MMGHDIAGNVVELGHLASKFIPRQSPSWAKSYPDAAKRQNSILACGVGSNFMYKLLKCTAIKSRMLLKFVQCRFSLLLHARLASLLNPSLVQEINKRSLNPLDRLGSCLVLLTKLVLRL